MPRQSLYSRDVTDDFMTSFFCIPFDAVIKSIPLGIVAYGLSFGNKRVASGCFHTGMFVFLIGGLINRNYELASDREERLTKSLITAANSKDINSFRTDYSILVDMGDSNGKKEVQNHVNNICGKTGMFNSYNCSELIRIIDPTITAAPAKLITALKPKP